MGKIRWKTWGIAALVAVSLCAALILPLGAEAHAAAPAYANDFSSDTLADFTAENNIGNFEIKNGVLTVKKQIDDILWFGADDWTDYTAEFEFTPLGGQFNGAFLAKAGDKEYQISFRSLSWPYAATGNLIEIYYDGKSLASGADYVNGKKALFADAAAMRCKVVVKREMIRVFVGGKLYLDYAIAAGAPIPTGKAGIKFEDSTAEYDNLVIRAVTDEDLAQEEAEVGNANSDYVITTRPGQTADINRRMDPAYKAISIAAAGVAGAAAVGFWTVFLIQILRRKKENDKK